MSHHAQHDVSDMIAGATLATMVSGAAPRATGAPRPLPDPSVTPVPDSPFPPNLTDDEERHLITLDELDFVVFGGAQWERLGESHAQDVRVHWPDGHFSDGLDQHIADMAAIFAFAPDTHIRSHPIRIAKDDLTCVTGVMAGTFTNPMPNNRGGLIAPTNKPYSMNMATVGIWNDHGTMDEKWLFFDDYTYFSQVGVLR